jgi:hypothetical protein
MPYYQAISQSTHANLHWKRYNTYPFAAQDAVAPLVVQELPRAAMALPVAFIEQDGHFIPAAVQGLQPGQNLFVAPDGRWIGPYTPAAYRGHPFAIASTPEGQQVLCVDADSGLISDTEGEAFFDEQGQPSQPVKDVLNFLQQVNANRELTQRLCAALQAEGLIQPWPITLKGESGEQTVQGLYRIDEAKLNSLSSEALHRIHQAGALPLVYCQLLSMQHLQMLGKLAEAHAQAKAQSQQALPTTSNGELDLEFLNNNGTISFGPH